MVNIQNVKVEAIVMDLYLDNRAPVLTVVTKQNNGQFNLRGFQGRLEPSPTSFVINVHIVN